MRIAVVLAGAVAKGAFEAGVLHTLVRSNMQIVRIVGSSSGALNGTMLAAAVRSRDLEAGTQRLVELWRDHAEWNDVFHARFSLIHSLSGVSDQARLTALLKAQIPAAPALDEIDLRLLVAPLFGVTGSIGDHPATTYESVQEFTSADFTTDAGLARVFTAATASSAFPFVFAPVTIDPIGPCVDGGAVNNTPMKLALEGSAVDAIVVVTTTVELRQEPPTDLHGIQLASHLGGMLIGERLYRDLRETDDVNLSLTRLQQLVDDETLTPDQLDRVLAALGWTDRKPVRVIQIRPLAELPGSSFAGFFDPKLRATYIDEGARRAADVLALT
ncbi:MAG: patatin-like phospholipase family protein [Kofleriaceae bacterium]